MEVAVLHLVLAEAAEGQREALAEEAAGHYEALAEAEVQRMGEAPDARPLPERREDRSTTAHHRSGAPPPGAASDR